ncbi:hypothetical protein ACJDU8_02015 [Clostridium sp. WILCCON 0269]|uniref:Uncharacterized protein n=1 Tax=Candidatus Clostridium eludens TaxID=3381663 RepID=A0ABW8SGA0_9CLOT
MNTITNIKINYMLLEQILRVTGTYKGLCDEHEFLDIIFKQAKTGRIDNLFRDDAAQQTTLKIIQDLTGLSTKYWSGEQRIELDIVCEDAYLNYDGGSIDTVNLENDCPFFDKDEGGGHAYHGKFYQEQLKNPVHLEYEEICYKVSGKKLSDSKEPDKELSDNNGSLVKEVEEAVKIIESLYSLRGLLTVILLNMANEVDIIDKANVYKHKKWEPYMKDISKSSKNGMTYRPKFIKIKKGLVQTIIKNIFDLGIVFTFRDYFSKEFTI